MTDAAARRLAIAALALIVAAPALAQVGNIIDPRAKSYVNAELDGQSFAGLKLAGHSFVNISARGANFRGADLQGASFTNADLSEADFRQANLRGARFVNVDWDGANLTGATWITGKACGPGSIGRCR